MRGDYWPQWRIDMLLELADGTRSAREIGDLMGVSKGTIHGKLHRLATKGVKFIMTPQAGKAGSAWTDAEVITLARLEADGAPLKTMSFRLGRSTEVVSQKRIKLKEADPDWPWSVLPLPTQTTEPGDRPEWRNHTKPQPMQPKKRACLCCGKPFVSFGPGNRLCDTHRRVGGDQDYHAHMPSLRF